MSQGNNGQISWEDLLGGGDKDFNDIKLNVTVQNYIAKAVPPPKM
jgi:hypothetical protein